MPCVREKKIVYQDGDDVRVLRGVIEREDEHFIYLKRDDGIFTIGKAFIFKIEEINDKKSLMPQEGE